MSSAPLVTNPAAALIHYLERLEHWLTLAEQTGNTVILSARLAPQMLPFASQTRTAARFAMRAVFPLFDKPLPLMPTEEPSFSGLRQEVAHIRQLISELPQSGQIRPAREILSETAGFSEVELPAGIFLSHYVLPNFYFHLSMVYAIARQNGVPLGKADFDGFHSYPAGFSFE